MVLLVSLLGCLSSCAETPITDPFPFPDGECSWLLEHDAVEPSDSGVDSGTLVDCSPCGSCEQPCGVLPTTLLVPDNVLDEARDVCVPSANARWSEEESTCVAGATRIRCDIWPAYQ